MLPCLRSSSVHRRPMFALQLLCFVQGCERFAFFTMLPLFVLYLHHRHRFAESSSLLGLGVFQALSYIGGLPASWLADRRLGAVAATLLGAAALALGYGGLALDQAALLWPALALMVVGHSFFKPSIHVLLADVSGDSDAQRERSFLWHYLAINLGCLVAPTLAEWVHARHGWATLFGVATAASVAGVAVLVLMARGLQAHHLQREAIPQTASGQTAPGSMRAVWLICSVAVVFWLTSQQASSSLMLLAAENTLLHGQVLQWTIELGPGHFSSLHALMVVSLLPMFLALNKRRHASAPSSTASKMVWGYVATAAAFVVLSAAGLSGADTGRVSPLWLVGSYALLSLAELLLAPLGVSLLTQLAPKQRANQAVGLWFAATAAGNLLGGVLGLLWERWPHHRYFGLVAMLSLVAAAVLLLGLRGLDQLLAHRAVAALQPQLSSTAHGMSKTATALPHASWVLPSLAVVLPVPLIVLSSLPLPLRAVGAIESGLAVLLCGSHLIARAIDGVTAIVTSQLPGNSHCS